MLFILDAYNIIAKIKQSKKWQDRRRGFLQFLLRHPISFSRKNHIIVVFDGDRNADIIYEFPMFEIVFSGSDTADHKIDCILKKRSPSQAVVVSDDREVKFYAKRLNLKAMAVIEFLIWKPLAQAQDSSDDKKLKPQDIAEINAELEKLWIRKNEC